MNLSVKWLTDYLDIKIPIKDLADGMTMSGSKVEKYFELPNSLSKIVAGHILSLEKHENSDKLWIALADIGKEEPLQIVTGATNIFAGAYVPIVLDGGRVINPSDGSVMNIKKGKLRGKESFGMMCGYQELSLNEGYLPYAETDGVIILNKDPNFENLKPGDDILKFLGINDTVIEFEITNNRPDCLSVIGLAKEAAATFDLPLNLKTPKFQGTEGAVELDVEIQNEKLCSRYMAAVVKNVKIASSPRWMQERLIASGVRPINNFVDITNFVMLEYGHPMHAFDKKYVKGNKITVRNAKEGEKITLLDGTEQTLNQSNLVIADGEKPIAVAGVMGGEYSGIMEDTENVVFESACFDGVSVRKTAKSIGRRTESSGRFEKGIDPENAKAALYRALELVEMLECGQVINEIIDEYPIPKKQKRIKHNANKINEIIGTSIHENEQVAILQKLGFTYDDGYVIPPSIRIDIELECDLAEEIARIYGYNNIKSTLPKFAFSGGLSEEEKFLLAVERSMIGLGSTGCLTFNFISPSAYEKTGIGKEKQNSITIRNPLGEAMSVMRTTMTPSMLEILAKNYSNRIPSGNFFEVGRIYLPQGKGELPLEKKSLVLGIFGEGEDFYSIKGIIEELLSNLSIENAKIRPISDNLTYHPGRCGEITVDENPVAIIGEVHPKVTEAYKINTRVYLGEVYLDELIKYYGKTNKFAPLPKYPSITRDLSLLCPDEMPAGEVEEVIARSGKNIEEIKFFDCYKGAQVDEGKKSLSYKIILRKHTATLTDKEADKTMEQILKALALNGVEIRKS